MSVITLYHGSQNKVIKPAFGYGEDKHDFGRGFYLTDDIDLAKEWAVCSSSHSNGWLHTYHLDLDGLKVFDFTNKPVLNWIAELMSHRNASDSRRYQVLAKSFIDKYRLRNISSYDVIRGWRANASYFFIAKEFVRDNVDIDILEDLLMLGDLGIQYCIKTELAFSHLQEDFDQLKEVDFVEYNAKYNNRDCTARENMRALVNSDKNKVVKVFSTLL